MKGLQTIADLSWPRRADTAEPNSLARLSVTPTGKALGAVVTGVDLAQPLSADIADALRRAWREHLVLLFPGQFLEPETLLRAASTFGQPQEGANRLYIRAAGIAQEERFPALLPITNLGPDGTPVRENDGLGSLEVVWHSDNSYIEAPPIGCLLYALEAPADSGFTSFANQFLAYERLPETLKRDIEGRWAKHDASRNSAGMLRPGLRTPSRPEEVPGPFHPLVIRQPGSARRALFLGRRRIFPSQYIEGLPGVESEALLDALWAAATHPDITWTHRWTPGDVLLWDNCHTLHHRTPVDATRRRVMVRTQFQGQTPRADGQRRHFTASEPNHPQELSA
ncbi:TauD/TfdA dioxygenase family protein [Azotobacter vinelandii]|uniref:TauD/TfdA dioxygenase family protein n=1 Tax=Azotobacter vinelandii TaxID=354 RepID=UPI002665BD05|nr:TauD/TfdA family dioxygenase [Azotobacter vinelandii]WKN24056.1 TauD/TfdA family dioxygenase [Azotobacter vinelandii]